MYAFSRFEMLGGAIQEPLFCFLNMEKRFTYLKEEKKKTILHLPFFIFFYLILENIFGHSW